MKAIAAATFFALTVFVLPASAQVSGEAIYKQRCAACHDSGSPRVPPRAELQKFSASRILRAMDFGVMNNIATKLRQDEREAVATYLGVPGGSDLLGGRTAGWPAGVQGIECGPGQGLARDHRKEACAGRRQGLGRPRWQAAAAGTLNPLLLS